MANSKIKELDVKFEERQKKIHKENADIYSKVTNEINRYNLNSIVYREVMIQMMDKLIFFQKKKTPKEKMFGGNIPQYVSELCAGRTKKSVLETVLEAVGVVTIVFSLGFLLMVLLGIFTQKTALSSLEVIRWTILLFVGLGSMLYFQKNRIDNQLVLMLLIIMIYMSASSMIDYFFKDLTGTALNVNTYIAIPVLAIVGILCLYGRNKVMIKKHEEGKRK